MSRLTLRLVLIPVVLLIGWGTWHMNRGKAGEEHRNGAHQLIRQVEGYSTKPDYYDWLVDDAHDHVFDEAYHTKSTGRRTYTSWVDEGQYEHDLFEWMIQQAKDDNALPVAAALEKFRTEHGGAGAAPTGATGKRGVKPPPGRRDATSGVPGRSSR